MAAILSWPQGVNSCEWNEISVIEEKKPYLLTYNRNFNSYYANGFYAKHDSHYMTGPIRGSSYNIAIPIKSKVTMGNLQRKYEEYVWD